MQFKKHIALLLAFFLLVSNSGLALNVHYCGNTIAAVSTVFSKEEVCEVPVVEEQSCCSKVESSHKKCCSDKEINLDDDTEKIVIKSFSLDLDSVFIFNEWQPTQFATVVSFSDTKHFDYYCDANAPPLYQLYSQYIFYA
ncbi:MAG: hypothetical protein J0L86_15250 [Flavobacteriales bacterium]|nr:hypothetical protein [Flavobacteriales bacterium]